MPVVPTVKFPCDDVVDTQINAVNLVNEFIENFTRGDVKAEQ